jgi:ribosomal protein S18 acetylase RimI-like enzyme
MAEDRIILREMQESDYEEVISLWKEAGLPFKPEGRDRRERIAQEIMSPYSIYLVALGGEKIIGSILGTHDGRKGWINRLAVLPGHRRRQVALQLVEEVERRLEEQQVHIVAALVEDENEQSLALFNKAGYTCHRDIVYLTKRKDGNT